jgi:thiol:disulfide interchange protein
MVFLSGFELLWQISLWSAGLAAAFAKQEAWEAILLSPYAINVIFALRLVVLVFAMSCFGVDWLRRIRAARETFRRTARSMTASVERM